MTTIMTKQTICGRDTAIDMTRGIGMLFVIVGHSMLWYSIGCPWMYSLIYTFHMPLFFLISGYCWKKRNVKKDAMRLLLPYAVMCTIFYFIDMTKYPIEFFYGNTIYEAKMFLWGLSGKNKIPINGDVTLVGTLWFLLAMFWCRQYFGVLRKYLHNDVVLLMTCAAVSFVTGYIAREIIRLPLDVLEAGAALVFFSIGSLVRKYELLKDRVWFAFICLVIWIVDACIDWPMDISTGLFRYYPLSVAGACCATYLIYILTKISLSRIAWMSNVLIWIGSMTMPIFCMHALHQRIGFLNVDNQWLELLIALFLPIILSFGLMKVPIARKLFGIR